MTRDHLDEVVFDYLEGNLLPEEKEAFEVLMNESEITSYEVKLWKNAYFTEPLPSVTELENKLIISTGNNGTESSIISRIFMALVTLSTSLLIGHYINSPGLLSSGKHGVTTPPSHCRPFVPVQKTEQVTEQKHDVVQQTKQIKPDLKNDPVEAKTEIYTSLPLALDEPFVTIEFSPEKIEMKTVQPSSESAVRKSFKKQLSRKETRAINAKKRKEHQRKMAAKFQKGNEPYVVPLSNNNF